ncbi:uncharacterized protein, partial [Clytia hemisphaerica]
SRKDANGKVIDANKPDVQLNPIIHTISEEDQDATLKIWPQEIQNGGRVTLLWSNVQSPKSTDRIAFYCPHYDKASHPLDNFPVTDSETWESGFGHVFLTLYNMRTNCGFRYYRDSTTLVAISNTVKFNNGGPMAPLHGHIAVTNDPTQMRVMWNSAYVSGAVVKYGLTKDLKMSNTNVKASTYQAWDMCAPPANTTGFWDPGYQYDVLLTGLLPNRRYYYAYGSGEYMSDIANFTTPLAAGNRSSFKFIVYGDMGVHPFPEGVTTAKLVRQEIEENDVRFVYHHGDISYARGYGYIWDQWFYLVQPYATLIPYMLGVGNHEQDHMNGHQNDPSKQPNFHPDWFNGHTDSGGECGLPMSRRFHMPENGLGLWWYSFDYGMVHMVMLSTEHDFQPGSNQYKWLENDLKNVDRKKTPFVLIGGHRAMYCSNQIEGDYIVATHMQEAFEDLLYTYKVDLALWAHYHLYERTCKVYKNKCVDDGVTHIVVGSAGKEKDSDSWYPDKQWSVFRIADYGYGRITVANETHMLYEFVQNRIDTVIDSVWITK